MKIKQSKVTLQDYALFKELDSLVLDEVLTFDIWWVILHTCILGTSRNDNSHGEGITSHTPEKGSLVSKSRGFCKVKAKNISVLRKK